MSAEDHIRSASAKLAAAEDDAQAELELAVAAAGEDPSVLVRAATLSFDNDHPQAARDWLARAAPMVTPDFAYLPWVTALAARLALLDGDAELGLDGLRAAFESLPGAPGFGDVLARELLRRGLEGEARDVVARALAAGAEDPALEPILQALDAR